MWTCRGPTLPAMDIVHARCTVSHLLSPGNPTLTRVCIEGPLRTWKNDIIHRTMARCRPRSVLELGGGRGGDAHHWARAAADGTLRRLTVVDVDGDSLREYARRLRSSHHAVEWSDGFWLPAPQDWGCEVRLHQGDARTVPPEWCGADPPDLVVLSFSVSQMVGGQADADALLQHLFGVLAARAVLFVVHDHVVAGLPTARDGGVTLKVVESPSCGDDALWCPAHHQGALLETTVDGSTLAQGIREWACHGGALIRAAPPTATVEEERPYGSDPDAHWLLRSLAAIHITRGPH